MNGNLLLPQTEPCKRKWPHRATEEEIRGTDSNNSPEGNLPSADTALDPAGRSP